MTTEYMYIHVVPKFQRKCMNVIHMYVRTLYVVIVGITSGELNPGYIMMSSGLEDGVCVWGGVVFVLYSIMFDLPFRISFSFSLSE